MAIIDADGFESGAVLLPNTTMSNPVVAVGRDGVGVALRSSTIVTMTKDFTSGSDRIYFHLGYFSTTNQWGAVVSTNALFVIQADGGATTHLTLNFDASGHLILRRGAANATIIATSTQTMSTTGHWDSIQATVLIADVSGECIVKVNGDTWISFSGDTKNAGTSTRPDRILFGVGGNSAWIVDDWLCQDTTGGANDSWTGEISIVGLRAAGNGATSGLTGSDGNQVDNFQQVDESPFNATDYNGSATVTALDTYDMTPIAKTGTVLAVQQITLAAKSDAGAKSFKHVQRGGSGGTVKSSAVALSSTSYLNYTGPIWLTDGDGNAWTTARVDAAEFGFEVA